MRRGLRKLGKKILALSTLCRGELVVSNLKKFTAMMDAKHS
jgi:hypothetical protein